MAEPIPVAPERRRIERRTNPTLAELTLPELRRMLVTTMMFVIVLVLFLWMVRTVIIAAILGVIVASFTRPIYLWLYRKIPSQIVAATLTLLLLIVPVVGLTAYSYDEVTDVAGYIDTHQEEIATRIDASLHKFPFLQRANTQAAVRHYVVVASNYGATILSGLPSAVASLAIAATIFVFTVYYVLSDADRILEYIWSRIPPRYGELSTALESNVRCVLYGAIYSTFLTQTIKTVIIFGMNVAFHVPLAAVLAIVSFIIGFFSIFGSVRWDPPLARLVCGL